MVDGAEGDCALLGIEELLDGWPGSGSPALLGRTRPLGASGQQFYGELARDVPLQDLVEAIDREIGLIARN